MPMARHGPEFSPVSREDRIDSWARAIQARLRYEDGGLIGDEEATIYADVLWSEMVRRSLPIKEIMRITAEQAIQDILTTNKSLVRAIDAFTTKKQEEPMKKPEGPFLAIGPDDAKESRFQIANCTIKVRNDSGEYERMAVGADLVIDHATLRFLVQKAHDNKTRKTHDGPITIIALGSQGAKRT